MKHFLAPSQSSIRYFSLLLGLVFLGLGMFTKLNFTLSLVLALIQWIGFASEKFWRFEYALLTTITEPIGKMVSFAALCVLFYGFLTPFSFLRIKKFPSGWKNSAPDIDPSKLYE